MAHLGTRRTQRVGLVGLLLAWSLACGSGPPEVRPGLFDSPTSTDRHGPIVESSYKRSDGPRTLYYKVLEVDGEPVDIDGGYIEKTSWCSVEGIVAVGLTVRGPPGVSGIYVLQVDDTEQILERICDFDATPGIWEGPLLTGCEVQWDAATKTKRPFGR